MIPQTGSTRMRGFARKVAAGCMLALAACSAPPAFLTALDMKTVQTTAQYTIGRIEQMWAAPTKSLIMVQRRLGTESEQLIGLRNDTTLYGDNFVWLHALGANGQATPRFQLSQLMQRFGSIPSPFTSVSNQNLNNAVDRLGDYFWLEYRTGVSTVCVLAFRRISDGARVLPGRATVMEVLMRNCVNGTVEDALAPIRDGQIGFGVISTPAAPQGGNRMMSPLAAPQQ